MAVLKQKLQTQQQQQQQQQEKQIKQTTKRRNGEKKEEDLSSRKTKTAAAAIDSTKRLKATSNKNIIKNNNNYSDNNRMPTTKAATLPAAAAAAAAIQQQNAGVGTGGGAGPRVSFNRDVHVKRIGKRPNELTNYEYETTNLQPPQNTVPYHQLPADLSEESIRKEAALVLAQAERHKSRAENADSIPTFKVRTKRTGGESTNPKKFHSLPTRKKKAPAKPVARSVSDVAAKKPTKRPSIFNIFSRKSDSNINQVERDPRFEDSGGRRLVRSKSDVGSYNKDEQRKLRKALKEGKSTQNGSAKQLPTQLSPIIENAQKEDYFAEQFNRERRKSDAITDREKHESGINELLERSRAQAEVDGSIVARTPVSHGIKEKILSLQSKSQENMHSSQLPPQKLPLTKGVTVNGLAKRLSMERFSPPPPLSGPAFSYIRPNEGITYAQLEMNEEQQHLQQNTLPRRDHMRDYRSPMRDIRSPDRELRPTVNGRSTDFVPSHNNLKNTYNHNHNHMNGSSGRVLVESRTADMYMPISGGPTTIRISSSHSPSPWQQLSPRNLSDEDEGLGIETRKYYEDDLPKMRSKSPAEPPIVPVIRSITPTRETSYEPRGYLSPTRDDPLADDLGYRRARLENRILTRRYGDSGMPDINGYREQHQQPQLQSKPPQPLPRQRALSPERMRDVHVHTQSPHQRYLSPEREPYEQRFHKPETTEILQKYSPERTHLDIISPSATQNGGSSLSKTERTSRYKHTTYYDDGHGGVKEVYERQTHLDPQGQPVVRETRHRERLDSYGERQPLNDYEPKSIDSQLTSTDQYRSSPENMKRYETSADRSLSQPPHSQRYGSEEHWHTSSSLKRDKLQQRSFDKGDSGIENDFRKESFNGDLTSRWRKRTTADDMRASDAFLKKERRHGEQQYTTARQRDNYIYRERSIDDGSHFDPHLDKYPVATSTLRRRDQHSQTGQGQDTLKRNKKLGGFEKVKQLFTGSSGGSGGGGGGGPGSHSSSNGTAGKKDTKRQNARTNSTTSSSEQTPSAKSQSKSQSPQHQQSQQSQQPTQTPHYMVKEEELRSRYREHRGINAQIEATREPKATDISTRRRLSTPKASPLLLKRTSSDKKKKESPLAKPEKTSWFKSLDRRSKSKSREKLNVSVNGKTETTSMKRTKANARHSAEPNVPPKNLRFFGDTDLDSNPPTITRAATTLKTRPSLSSTLNRSQKYSQSAYHLDRIKATSPARNGGYNSHTLSTNATASRHKSSSMHNLENGSGGMNGINGHGGNGGNDEVDFRKRRHYSRSRDLDDISESGSETEEQHKRSNGVSGAGARTLSRERLDRTHRYDEHAYRRGNDRQTPTASAATSAATTTTNGGDASTLRRMHPLNGPPKPARSAERRILSSYSRERDRFPAESSGTEGESSLHSQRSIVYLHATTVGAIPQPYHMRRRSISRDDLRSQKSGGSKCQTLQPMTRTVSRSVSMLAPWKPKLISEGYEINYSQEQNQAMSTLPRKPLANGNSMNTLKSKKSETSSTGRTRRHLDDQSSLRNSSTTSASKSALSTNLRNADARRKVK